jgi:hypothetical protein
MVSVVLLATVGLIGLHLWTTRDIRWLAPGPPDQYAYLGNARWLSGDPHLYLLPESAYYGFGYSLFLVPVYWLFDDPESITRGVLVVNALLMASMLPLLYLLCRTVLHARRNVALLAAGVGAVVPAAFWNTSRALAENLILPLCIATVLACWLFLQSRRTWQRVLFGPSVALLFASHDRFLFVVAWAIAFMVLAAALRVVSARLAVLNVAATIALLGGTLALRRTLMAARWVDGELARNQFGQLAYYRRLLINPTDAYRALVEFIGHGWYLAAGTVGLALLGLWFLITETLRDRRRAGSRGVRGWLADPRRLTLLFLLISGLVMFMTSVLYFTRVYFLSEGFIYGRYNEAFIPMWVAAGVVFVLSEQRRRQVMTASVGAALLTAGLALWLVASRDRVELTGFFSSFGVPDVARFAKPGRQLVPIATYVALGAIGLLLLVSATRRRPHALLLVFAIWLASGGVTVVTTDNDHFEDKQMLTRVARLGISRAALNVSDHAVPEYYQFHLPDLFPEAWDPRDGQPDERFVFDKLAPSRLPYWGGRIVMLDGPIYTDSLFGYTLALWVRPGPELVSLDRGGKLLPPGFPSALPPPAKRSELRVADGTGGQPLDVPSGAEVRVEILGRHIGEGSPWPDANSFDKPGRVRLGARPRDAGEGGVMPQTRFAELDRWVLPGESFAVAITLGAVDDRGRPLPPGRYVYALDLEQVGFGWFTSPERAPLQITLNVT